MAETTKWGKRARKFNEGVLMLQNMQGEYYKKIIAYVRTIKWITELVLIH